MYEIIKHKIMVSGVFLLISCIFVCFIYVKSDSETISEIPLTTQSVYVPVIMYHSLLKDKSRQNKYVISPTQFEQDLIYLKENGYSTIVMQDLIDYVYNGVPLPEKPIILSFDDGYYNNYIYAYSLLEKYDAKIVISIIGEETDKFSLSGETNPYYSHLTWDLIREMTDSGRVEFQNHSYDFHKLSPRKGSKRLYNESFSSYKNILSNDLLKLQKLMEDNTGITPTTYTYPYGAVSKGEEDIIKELGFKCTLTCANKINIITKGDTDSLYGINRFLRPSGISSENFFTKKVKLQEYFKKECIQYEEKR